MASQITSLTIVYTTVHSGADQREHQSSASLAFVRGIHLEFPAQMASNAESISIWWRHHEQGIHEQLHPTKIMVHVYTKLIIHALVSNY